MTITKNVLNLMIFFLTYKRSLAKSANSQQPTANSQQPTANSQQPTANSQQPTANSQQPTGSFNKNNIQFWYIYYFANKSGFGFFPVALFLCLFGSLSC